MRYSARRQWAHPVLRPGSDDYPDGYRPDESGMEPPHILPDGTVEFAITWRPALETIRRSMEMGEAVLCGLVYCQSTYFRTVMEAPSTDPFRAVTRVDTQEMRGRIEIHPLIVAKGGRVRLEFKETHEEYGDGGTVLERAAPLAVDQYWSIEHDPSRPPLESFVQLQVDDGVEKGRFALSGTLGERQLVIRLNKETFSEFTRIRTEAKARAGLYLPALTAACQRIARASVAEDAADGPTDSWNAVVDRLLAKPDPDAEYNPCYIERIAQSDDLWAKRFPEDLEAVEPEDAAQRLLGAPVGAMLEREGEALAEDDPDEAAEEERSYEA